MGIFCSNKKVSFSSGHILRQDQSGIFITAVGHISEANFANMLHAISSENLVAEISYELRENGRVVLTIVNVVPDK